VGDENDVDVIWSCRLPKRAKGETHEVMGQCEEIEHVPCDRGFGCLEDVLEYRLSVTVMSRLKPKC
jgi:hypothetical protein